MNRTSRLLLVVAEALLVFTAAAAVVSYGGLREDQARLTRLNAEYAELCAACPEGAP